MNWLKDTRDLTTSNSFPVLLYRASRDGWTGANFHSCCDNKGPTVIVVKGGSYIKQYYTFGVYEEEDWEGVSEGYTKDSILYSCLNRGQQEQHAVCCCRKYGPVLRYGCDYARVQAPNDCGINCSVVLGHTYMTVHERTIDEMEVFGFEKSEK
ncbi:hypothetical protein ACROYT_G044298 [Oculina patagonica]